MLGTLMGSGGADSTLKGTSVPWQRWVQKPGTRKESASSAGKVLYHSRHVWDLWGAEILTRWGLEDQGA